MNKYELFSFPENIDVANPYGLDEIFTPAQITKVNYTQGLSLLEGQWTYDTDEKAYWFSPALTSSNYRVGYIRISKAIDFLISAGDEITVEFELKALNLIDENQKVGVHSEIKNSVGSILTTLNFIGNFKNGEYTYCKIKQIVPIHLNAENFNFVVGAVTSSFTTPYSFKIRNIRINIKHNSSTW